MSVKRRFQLVVLFMAAAVVLVLAACSPKGSGGANATGQLGGGWRHFSQPSLPEMDQ